MSKLMKFFKPAKNILEIGIDEVGRGPLFGRVYTAAVILPKDDSFDHFKMKDSKKFHSEKKIQEVSDYIKKNAIAWSISWEDEKVIDNMNILQATQQSMHTCIDTIIKTYNMLDDYSYHLLVDGSYFNPYIHYNPINKKFEQIDHDCIVGGDDKYTSIAAASILAKVARDTYIKDLCEEYPELNEKYSIGSNKGYGAKKHMDGIILHGITEWHRQSFKPCSQLIPTKIEKKLKTKTCQLSGESVNQEKEEEKEEKKIETDYKCDMSEFCPINSNCFSLSPECKKITSYAPFF
jgi:ribonuclease HII